MKFEINSVSIVIVCVFTIYTMAIERIHFSKRLRDVSGSNVFTFETVLLKSIDFCITTCKVRKKCRFINYHVRTKTCYLLHASENEDFSDGLDKEKGYIFGNKSEWNMGEFKICDDCNDDGDCLDMGTQEHTICESSGCKYPEHREGAAFKGNMFSAGSNIMYECTIGNAWTKRNVTISKCLQNGKWSSMDFECQREYACYYYSQEDRALLPTLSEKGVCERHEGNVFSQGNNGDYLGAISTCWCIKVKTGP